MQSQKTDSTKFLNLEDNAHLSKEDRRRNEIIYNTEHSLFALAIVTICVVLAMILVYVINLKYRRNFEHDYQKEQ